MNESPEDPADAAGEFEAAQVGNSAGTIQYGHASEVEVPEGGSLLIGDDRRNVFADERAGLLCWCGHAR